MSWLTQYVRISSTARLAVVFLVLGFSANIVYRSFYHVEVKHYVMGSDMEGYYQYLPYFFLHDWDDFKHLPWAKQFEQGKTLDVFTCGVAMMQAPFFLMAHATSVFFQLENSNGYNNVYFGFIFFAALFYVLIGLFFLYKALGKIFKQTTALWVTALIFFSTNLFYYTIVSPGMSHAYSFCLMSIYIYMVPVFYDKPDLKRAVFLSAPVALATLIRPTNFVAVLYFIFYGIGNLPTLKLRFQFWLKKWYLLIVIILVGIVVMIPQMAYWHFVTGKFIYYSYQEEGFPFFWSPHILTVLFGARNGWYIYTPLMFFATLSLFYLVYRRKLNSWLIMLIMALIIYIDASWWAPTFSAAAGYRALIGFLPFMAIPFAFAYERTYAVKSNIFRGIVTVLLLFLIFYNIQFSFKYTTGLWWDTDWHWNNLLRIFRF